VPVTAFPAAFDVLVDARYHQQQDVITSIITTWHLVSSLDNVSARGVRLSALGAGCM
jgi:hypothetical protein